MNVVWAFGDSMTKYFGHGAYGDSPYEVWLGRNAKHCCDMVAEHFGYDVINKGQSGSSNNQIFSDFLKYHKDIKSGDIVIIGWSPIMRYRIGKLYPANSGKSIDWVQVWASGFNPKLEIACTDNTYLTEEVANHLLLNRYEFKHLYSQEVNEWISFIKEWAELKNVKVVIWSWCDKTFGGEHSINLDIPIKRRTDITKETNEAVGDGHYGEIGMRELADEIIEYLNK